MGWDIQGGPGGTISFFLSRTAPLSGFYLQHTDPLSQESVFFSSNYNPLPVPGAALLGCVGLAFASWLGKRKREV